MRDKVFFFQVKIGGLFFKDLNPDSLPYIKIEDHKARTPGGAIEEITEQTLVFQTNVRVRV